MYYVLPACRCLGRKYQGKINLDRGISFLPAEAGVSLEDMSGG